MSSNAQILHCYKVVMKFQDGIRYATLVQLDCVEIFPLVACAMLPSFISLVTSGTKVANICYMRLPLLFQAAYIRQIVSPILLNFELFDRLGFPGGSAQSAVLRPVALQRSWAGHFRACCTPCLNASLAAQKLAPRARAGW